MSESIAEDVAAIERLDVVPKILEVVCRATGMGFAAVARVTDTHWIACAVRDEIEFGLKPGGELELRTTICNEIRDSGQPVVIDHVALDPTFATHHTPARYGFQSYISMPIRHRGEFFGTLCAIDPKPARLKATEVVPMFELFADLIGRHLDGELRLQDTQAALLDERQTAELRDQFIAVLGHDLRNPLASVSSGVRLISKTPLNEKAVSILSMIQSSVGRMAGLIDNVLDFARGRLGGGITIRRGVDPDLLHSLEQVILELRTSNPDRLIEVDVELHQPIECDSRRIAQLFSNLLGNALVHGSPAAPARVYGRIEHGIFTLSVANGGEPIPAGAMQHIFRPFSRTGEGNSNDGLGLGLYIAAEIARAHGGTLSAVSDLSETRFTFEMPVKPRPLAI